MRRALFLLLWLSSCVQTFEVELSLEAPPALAALGASSYQILAAAAGQPTLFITRPVALDDPLAPIPLALPREGLGLSYRFRVDAVNNAQAILARGETTEVAAPEISIPIPLVLTREIACNNQRDEDLNGLFDCEDPECAESPNCLCGNGHLDEGEACDDGNSQSDDGCNLFCEFQQCGDGILTSPGEECDDGNTIAEDACTTQCILARCGDGLLFSGAERCDDGNLLSGDGCSEHCLLELSALPCTPIPAQPYQSIVSDVETLLWSVDAGSLTGELSTVSDLIGQYPVAAKQPIAMPTGGVLLWGHRARLDGSIVSTLMLIDRLSGSSAWIVDEASPANPTTAAVRASGEVILGLEDGLRVLRTDLSQPVLSFMDEGFASNDLLAFSPSPSLPSDLLFIASGDALAVFSTGAASNGATLFTSLSGGASLRGISFDLQSALYLVLRPTALKRDYVMKIDIEPQSFILEEHFVIEESSAEALQAITYNPWQDQLLLLDLASSCVRSLSVGNAASLDGDGDGLSDEIEESNALFHGLLRDEVDSDGDGLSDGFEFSAAIFLGVALSPVEVDSDQDGLIDAQDLPAPPP